VKDAYCAKDSECKELRSKIAHLEMLVANRNEIIDKLDLSPQTKPLSDEDLDKLIKDAEDAGFMEMYIVGLIDGFNHAKAKVRGEK
jgi:hypothetical protein